MITKSRIIGLAAILVVGFLILRCGDESPDSDNRREDPRPTGDRRLQSRAPTFPGSSREWQSDAHRAPPPHGRVSQKPLSRRERGWGEGIEGRRSAPVATPPYGERRPYPEQPYPGAYPGGSGVPDPYGAQARIRTNGYRFRPLAEPEQKRRQAAGSVQYPDPSAIPYSPPPRTQPQATVPAPYPALPAPADPPREIYSFRPLKKSPGARGRWQGPYGQPGGHIDPYSTDPWSSSPDTQWGSTPPSQRMYPSLQRAPDRRLTAR